MNKKTLTVFTPAFNRAHTLNRTFESLCRQVCKDFDWLIIDDGSTDGTTELVRSWICTKPIPIASKVSCNKYTIILENFEGSCAAGFHISYIRQENQGMHGAHNTAYRNIHTELNTCIDSDDFMPDDAVEKIINFWHKFGNEKYAGLIGLDQSVNGNIIGTSFPQSMKATTLQGFYEHGGKGDKKLVYRTDVITQYPEYPIFAGERYVGLSYKYMLIDRDWQLLTLNEPLVIVEYMSDGSSLNMYKQYWNNPQGWIFLRKVEMKCTHSLRRLFIVCAHYVSSSIKCRNRRFLAESPNKMMTIAAIPIGILLYHITKYKVKQKSKR